jgi:response regulator RpfG family c-di-GMP phosphodiesterase
MSPLASALIVLLALTAAPLAYAGLALPRTLKARLGQSIRAFSRALELRCPAYMGQPDRLVRLCRHTGRRLGLSPRRLEALEMAARLRDLGLCEAPYRFGGDGRSGRWGEETLAVLARNPRISAAMIRRVPRLRRLASTIQGDRHGSLEARILSAAAELVWTDRLQGPDAARQRLAAGSGWRHDPRVVEALLQVLTSTRAPESEPLVL